MLIKNLSYTVLLLTSYIFTVNAQTDHEQLWKVDPTTLTDSVVNNMIHLCTQKWQQLVRSDVDSSLLYAQKAVELSKQLQNDSLLFQSLRREANSFIQQGSFVDARATCEQMLPLVPPKDPYPSFRYHQTLGLIDFYEGKYEDALKNHFTSLEFAQAGNLINDIPGAYAEISRVFDQMGQPLKALEYSKEDLAFTLQHGEDRGKFIAHYNLANRYVALDSFDQALSMYDVADSLAQVLAIPVFRDAVTLSKGRMYNQLGDPDRAVPLLEEALQGMLLSGNRRGYLTAQINLGNSLNDLARYEESVQVLRKAYEGITTDGFQHLAQNVRQAYAEALYNTDQGEQAYQLLDEYRIIQDSIKGEETSRAINELEIQYQTAEKERELLEQRLTVDQRTRQRNGLFYLAGFLGSLIVFVYVIQRQRIRKNQLLAIHEKEIQSQKILQLQNEKKLLTMASMMEGQEAERIRIAKDLHDGLGGLLSTVKTHFSAIQSQIQALESINVYDKVNDLIDTASAEVRRISHNMAPHALQISGLRDGLQDLCDQAKTPSTDVQYEWLGKSDRLPENLEIMLYRIVQELLHNVTKYAQAENVLVQLSRYDQEINLIVEDDGIGFNYQEALLKGGMGLKSVQSRVDYLKGHMDVSSIVGEGTSFSIQIKVKAEN